MGDGLRRASAYARAYSAIKKTETPKDCLPKDDNEFVIEVLKGPVEGLDNQRRYQFFAYWLADRAFCNTCGRGTEHKCGCPPSRLCAQMFNTSFESFKENTKRKIRVVNRTGKKLRDSSGKEVGDAL